MHDMRPPVLLRATCTALLAHVLAARALHVDDAVCAMQTGVPVDTTADSEELRVEAGTQHAFADPTPLLDENGEMDLSSRAPLIEVFRRTLARPQATNLKGQRFHIVSPGNHTFLVIPRGATEEDAELHIQATVENVGPPCNGLLFLTGLTFKGSWFPWGSRSVNLVSAVDGEILPEKAIKFRVDGSRKPMDMSTFKTTQVAKMVNLTVPDEVEVPTALNKPVTTMEATLKFGPSITAKVSVMYQKEDVGFSNSLWFTATNLGGLEEEIGGILGLDDHRRAARVPKDCRARKRGDILQNSRQHRRSIHASAFFGPGDEG